MTKINIQKGGKVIASGGFGCIFEPALKCVNGPSTGELTKLMTKKHAEDEYNQIQDFKKILENIPNYSEYFLIDGFSICQPKQLTNNDLKNGKHDLTIDAAQKGLLLDKIEIEIN
jgi:hypothetical protein